MIGGYHTCNRDSFVNLYPITGGIPESHRYTVTPCGQSRISVGNLDSQEGVGVTSFLTHGS